jgi:hypothetical protein
MRGSIILVLVWLLGGLSLNAQSWETLSELKPGDRIKVVDAAGETHAGSFASVSASAITLTTSTGELAVERARVRRVQVRSGSRRLRNALIGAAVGVAFGAAVDQSLGAYLRNEAGEQSGARAVSYAAPIAIFGGIGAAIPSYRTVYRAR